MLENKIETRAKINIQKKQILSASSPYQIGGQEGNRPQQHLFVIRSVIARQRKMGKMVMINLFDLTAFFDKESLRDVMSTLYEIDNPKS